MGLGGLPFRSLASCSSAFYSVSCPGSPQAVPPASPSIAFLHQWGSAGLRGGPFRGAALLALPRPGRSPGCLETRGPPTLQCAGRHPSSEVTWQWPAVSPGSSPLGGPRSSARFKGAPQPGAASPPGVLQPPGGPGVPPWSGMAPQARDLVK